MKESFSPLRYPGGKACYYQLLSDIIDLNQLEKCVYVEPFAGGAGAALSLLESGKVSKIILNDLDFAIYSFWFSILNYTKSFIEIIEKTPICIEEWLNQKHIYKTEKNNILKLGFATFYLNRCNRAGIISANPIGGIRQTGNYKIDARFNKAKLILKINNIASKKKKIKISNLDAIDCINELNYRKKSVLIYFDPPYYKKSESLYLNHFNHEDHIILRNSIINCKYPWVLSYDNSGVIVDLYSNKKIYRKLLTYSINGSSKAHELIVSELAMPSSLEKLGIKYE